MPQLFQYVFIPADSSLSVEIKNGDMSGGLTNDILVQSAKDYFFAQSGGAAKALAWQQATSDQRHAVAKEWRKHNNDESNKMTDDQIVSYIQSTQVSPSCEIMALTVPTKGNMYRAISMYASDDHSSSMTKTKNYRASQLLMDCGHRLPETQSCQEAGVYGDIFVGRCYDNELDESEGWKRLDFTLQDLEITSDWIQIARQVNGGGGLGGSKIASLSGLMKQQVDVNNAQPSNNDNMSLGYKWEQTDEEVELCFCLAGSVTAKEVKIKFQRSHLTVKVGNITLVEGETGGGIIIDECTYTLQDDRNNQRELCIIMLKGEEGRVWARAVKQTNTL
eukprot:CAMPEP_0194136404 /NCGR_PEP_ID=MMETSP0152-20130528/6421_1 /TAXON_ID=1049557 /ORGANISM="Thalassiothrix antarctica, Strain L6-D1" /LENGTH=333 /DNA_ID=CAMNT_0038833041 /DNA_START=14 /DNA_END=1015 /DNA_ORIENTATION=-